ncbi:uncharacterized protein VDAG_02411 [Verticillium dahliae VdLs.17]|uniref:BZIP domain-containing protein n=1 Tax=Verticillium dahliae (strain VdLs.17 / ATCC MYA-4575 / FGSC 10137) TaxID=498257 RepID=G2WXS9_VERDV|nr:uncharacterized protein VDAG_02411 [Verticillium dahliae VdLs.17]EGY20887.1 hypothetical protein VDAG_02411 [Verticillium dahliae VdLs.17]
MAPSTRKGRTRSLPVAKAGARPNNNINAIPRGAPNPFSFRIISDGQPIVHDGGLDKVRQPQQEYLPAEALSTQPKRRGRPPKASSAQKPGSTVFKTVVPNDLTNRRLSASSIDSSLSAQSNNPSSHSEKKTRLRARNREAAHKCRIRKQRGIQDLQTQEAAIGAVNQSLKDQYAELRDEILLLKNMVLQHGGCGCSFIESYLENAAASLTQKPDSFTTSRHGSSSSAISPGSSWSLTTPRVPGSPGFTPLEDETSNASHFDWDMMGGFINFHEGG